MLPRTFLSIAFPYVRWEGTRYKGLLGGDDYYSSLLYWREGATAIPEEYDERIARLDGIYDDGKRLVWIVGLDIVRYPSWDYVIVFLDRSSGQLVERAEANWANPPRSPFITVSLVPELITGDITPIPTEQPLREALGGVESYEAYSSNHLYIRDISQAYNGQIWVAQDGPIRALTRARMSVETRGYEYVRAYPAVAVSQLSERSSQGLGLAPVVNAIVDYNGSGSSGVAPSIQRMPEMLSEVPPSVYAGAVQVINAPHRYTAEEVEQARRQLEGVDMQDVYRDQLTAYGESYGEMLLETVARTAPGRALPFTYHESRAHFDPGVVNSFEAGVTFDALGVYAVQSFLVRSDLEVLLAPYQPNGSDRPTVQLGIARVTRLGTFLSAVAVFSLPRALAFDGHQERVWVLGSDNTALCIDIITGEPLAYFWLPIPVSLSSVTTPVKIAWQRSHKRLLVCALLPSNDADAPRNRWQTRIAGYSTTPIAVHVCRPIPLRPVRAGRPTPFLVRQVGSLCEPIAGLVTLTPGAGVTIDRAIVPLDESGESHVMATASAAGSATLTASIEVEATWDAPAVAAPFSPAQTWIEGL